MARKLLGGQPDDEQTTDNPAQKEASEEERRVPRPSRIMRPSNMVKGGVAAPRYIEGSTKSLADRTHEDIPVDQIQDSAIQDRIDLSQGIEELMASIETDGQKVPIIVRIVNKDRPYEIVAGRRRLEAVRRLGHKSIRGFIHKMNDVDAFRLQGIENNKRVETSFIERARTAAQAQEAGIDPTEISDFLAISTTMVSFMRRIFIAVGEPLVGKIGPAAGVGRRRWESLMDTALKFGMKSEDLISLVDTSIKDSADRFEDLYKKVHKKPEITARKPEDTSSSREGTVEYMLPSGKFETVRKPRQIVVKATRGATSELLDFLDERLPALIEEFNKKQEDTS